MRPRHRAARRLCPLLALCGLTAAAAAQAPPIVWAASYDGPASLHDRPSRVVCAPEGVYVAGTTQFPDTGWDFAIVRYSRAGELLWERSFGGSGKLNDRPPHLAAHPGGGVVLSGYTEGASAMQATTLRYSREGELLWERHHDLIGFVPGEAARVAIAPDGSAYVSAASGNDFLALAYGPDGTPLWQARLDLSNGASEWPSAIALGEDGGVYLAGPFGDNAGGFATVKLDAAGAHAWTHYDPVTAGLVSGPAFLAPAPGGGVVVSTVPTSTCGVAEARTWRLAPDGTPLWDASFAPDSCDTIATADIAVGRDGSVVILARTIRRGQPGSSNYGTFKYDSAGRFLWYQYLDGGAGKSDFPAAVTLDRAGNVYVTGQAYRDASNRDAMTASYTPAGALRWVDFFDAGSTVDVAGDIAISHRAEVVITGAFDNTGQGLDFFTVMYRRPLQSLPPR